MKAKGGNKKSKKWLVVVIIILLLLISGGVAWWWLTQNSDTAGNIFGSLGAGSNTKPIYSNMTGLEITNADENNAPTFCVQIPNGSTDGARPQVGLKSAAVVFEAIAETGITRFAAIFQDMTNTGIIGPIRSLRPYYLQWDTPFDCTIVHDGGSSEALAEVGNGKYRNLDENFTYMWKENYINGQYRYWNNVFTTPAKLLQFNQDRNYSTSNPQTFARLTPTEATDIAQSNLKECAAEDSDCLAAKPALATQIRTAFTNLRDYTVNYQYDAATNTYLRFYEGNGAHEAYVCSDSQFTSCTLEQVAPNVVVIMRVQEHTMADGYHEQIQTSGSGEAYIFQNGQAIKGKWQKSSQREQIKFTDLTGTEIQFTPGQLWIAAVPQFGNASWE